jgi:hypothetical protein
MVDVPLVINFDTDRVVEIIKEWMRRTYPQLLPDPRGEHSPGPVCQYCLADARYTPVGEPSRPRCPVCGAAYSGPRRAAEYRQLVEAGLVAKGD